jgi:NAD(P)-dependent dehydrogenase (short-subunit alcohol dehydrogenase family)
MLLQDKYAVIYGAGGPVGAAVSRAFARESAKVALAGRSTAKLDELAQDIAAAYPSAVIDVARVDVLDEEDVRRHADRLAEKTGGLDICFNAVGDEADLGTPLLDLPLPEFLEPVIRLVTAQFLIAKAVARHMRRRRSGVLLTMTGSGTPTAGMGGAMTAWAAVDALCGQLARELGPHGVRVVWLRSNGVTADGDSGDPAELARSMLGRLASPSDAADVAAFLASDRAGTMTATAANITSGAEVG